MLHAVLCNKDDAILGNIAKKIEELSYMPCRNNEAYCEPMEDAVGYNYMGGYVGLCNSKP
jgi:hypothetical protein